MQVEHSSKYNIFTGVNKCVLAATSASTSASSSSSTRTTLRNNEENTNKTPKIQYLTPTCVLFTYDDTDIGTLLDEHFRKSLANTGKGTTRHRNLPASYWNRHYTRAHRSSAVLANAAAAAAASMAVSPGNAANTAGFGYYQDAYSSLLRSHHQASLCWPSYPAVAVSAHQANSGSADAASTSRDFSTQAATAAYGLSAEASILNGHMNEAVHAYNPFLSLTRPTANAGFVGHSRIPAPPQYQNIRNDWTSSLTGAAGMDNVARDFTTAHHPSYQFSGLNPAAPTHHQFPITESHQHKDALCFPHAQ